MHYKLLALDLDGTALSDPDTFAPGLAEAAARAAAAGCIVAAATGRPGGCLPAALTPCPDWISWLVLFDGAEIRDAKTGAYIWRKPFSAASLEQIGRAAGALQIPAEYIDRDSWYHLTDADRQALNASGITGFHKKILTLHGCGLKSPVSSLAGREILKINMPLVPQELRGPFQEQAGAAALVMDCGPGGLELTALGAGKWPAVAFLAGHLGLTLEDVMALGDSGNDAALLAAAGLGVAMGNAPDSVKAAAKAVTGRNTEGGAAQAIHRWLLDN